jgi:nickel transport protein
MKSLIRWGATLGLVASTIIGSSFVENLKALGLTDDQVAQILRNVPVFTVGDAQGAPLVASVRSGQNNNNTTSVTGVFISQRDAQTFIDGLKKNNPDLGKTVRVIPVSLGEIYKLAQANRSQQKPLVFDLVPRQQQVDSAMAILRQNGKEVKDFQGVPIFFATVGNGKEEGYLTIQRQNQQVMPLFFEKEQLQNLVEAFKKQNPKQAGTVKIQVAELEGVIQTLKDKNDPMLSQVVLVPSQESIDFLRSLPAASGNNQAAPRTNKPQPRTNTNTNQRSRPAPTQNRRPAPTQNRRPQR